MGHIPAVPSRRRRIICRRDHWGSIALRRARHQASGAGILSPNQKVLGSWGMPAGPIWNNYAPKGGFFCPREVNMKKKTVYNIIMVAVIAAIAAVAVLLVGRHLGWFDKAPRRVRPRPSVLPCARAWPIWSAAASPRSSRGRRSCAKAM